MWQSTEQLELEKKGLEYEIHEKKNYNFWSGFFFWIGIFVLLAFLGFNVLNYLGETSEFFGKIIDDIKNFFAPVLKVFGITLTTAAKQTIQTGSTGAKGLIDAVSNTSVSGLDSLAKNMNPAPTKTNPKDDKSTDDKKDKDDEKDNDDKKTNNQNVSSSDTVNQPNNNNSPTSLPPTNFNKNESITSPKFPISTNIPEPSNLDKSKYPLSSLINEGQGYCYLGTQDSVATCHKVDNVTKCPHGYGWKMGEGPCRNDGK